MAEAAVEFLIEKLKQLLIHHAHLFPGEVEKLDNHLRRFKASTGDAPEQRSRRDEQLTEPISRIRNAVHDAEDAIDAYVTRVNLKSPLTLYNRRPDPPNIVRTVEEIGAALEKIRCIYGENSRTDYSDHSDVEDGGTAEIQEKGLPVKGQNVVVGIEDDVQRLVTDLVENSTELQVISIIGMAGLGKTILAREIFQDANIEYSFPIRIWVYVSREFTAREIFLHILKGLTILSDDIKRRTDQELADLVASFLRDDRFLLVMDDLYGPLRIGINSKLHCQ